MGVLRVSWDTCHQCIGITFTMRKNFYNLFIQLDCVVTISDFYSSFISPWRQCSGKHPSWSTIPLTELAAPCFLWLTHCFFGQFLVYQFFPKSVKSRKISKNEAVLVFCKWLKENFFFFLLNGIQQDLVLQMKATQKDSIQYLILHNNSNYNIWLLLMNEKGLVHFDSGRDKPLWLGSVARILSLFLQTLLINDHLV